MTLRRSAPLIALLLFGCAQAPVAPQPAAQSSSAVLQAGKIVLTGPGREVVLAVELATTGEQHARGLMGRTELPEGTGMLFVFGTDTPLRFWMKNTLIPMDVLYFRADGSFVSAAAMTPCTADPCPTYPSDSPAAYALEVAPGSAEEWGVDGAWTLGVPGAAR